MDQESMPILELPDDDLVPHEPDPKDEHQSWVFISHTSSDEPFVRREIEPLAFDRHLVLHLLNKNSSPVVSQPYKRQILRSLSRCAWFIVIISSASIVSKWVRFEVSWAMAYRKADRIIGLLIDDSNPLGLHPKLQRINLIDYRQNIEVAQEQLRRGLPDGYL